MVHPIAVTQQGRHHSSRFSVFALALDLFGTLAVLFFSVFGFMDDFHGFGIIAAVGLFVAFVFMAYATIRDFGTQVTLDGESIIKTTLDSVQTFKLSEVNAMNLEEYSWPLTRVHGDDGHVMTVQFAQMRRGYRLMAAIINQVRDARPGVQVSPRLLKLAARYVMEGRA